MESLQVLRERALSFSQKASSIIIHDAASLKIANDFVLAVKVMRKEISDAFNPIIEKAHRAHKEAIAQKNKYEQPLVRAENAIKLQIGVYVRTKEEERREAERKAREEEQKRLQAETEVEAEAQRFENAGYIKEAEEIRETKPEPDVAVLPDAPSLNGISIRKILKYKVLDIRLVPKELLKKNWQEYLYEMIDSMAVTKYVKEHKGKMDIPGLIVYYEDSVAVSTKSE